MLHEISLIIRAEEDGLAIDRFLAGLNDAIRAGKLQTVLENVNADSGVYIVTGLAGRPTAAPIITPSPIIPSMEPTPRVSLGPAGSEPNGRALPRPTTAAPIPTKPTPAVTPATPPPTTASPAEPTFPPDVDECARSPNPYNFNGGYCVNRLPAYGYYGCGCRTMEGWLNGTTFDEHGVTSCIDLDECLDGDGPCHPHSMCVNLSPPDQF